MYEILDSPENVFAMEVVGKLEKDDYEKVLVPAVQKMIDGPGVPAQAVPPRASSREISAPRVFADPA